MENKLFSDLIKLKQKGLIDIKNKYNFSNQNKLLWIMHITDENILKNLSNWLKILPCNFVILSKREQKKEDNIVFIKNDINPDYWFDFFVCDNEQDCKLNSYFKKWIVPIINKDNHMSSLLKEFNPMVSEWNSFLYSEKDEWWIFYAIVRCLENMKFSQDKKNLVKNIFEI